MEWKMGMGMEKGMETLRESNLAVMVNQHMHAHDVYPYRIDFFLLGCCT